MARTKIESIDKLKEIAENKVADCFISLAGGAMRSSKDITYDPETNLFQVFNLIDESEQLLSEDGLSTRSNIAEAIENGAFYKY